MAKKQITLDFRTREFIKQALPDALVGNSDNRFLKLVSDLVEQVNEANGFTTTTAAPTTTAATTTAAPTTTVAGTTTAPTTTIAGTTTTAHP